MATAPCSTVRRHQGGAAHDRSREHLGGPRQRRLGRVRACRHCRRQWWSLDHRLAGPDLEHGRPLARPRCGSPPRDPLQGRAFRTAARCWCSWRSWRTTSPGCSRAATAASDADAAPWTSVRG
ncbi:hypothetical protein QJS66_13730 [Kocuria rhizophila]|nr:hypothetical protein QJS66_13730 [Kocuria rhizophila]